MGEKPITAAEMGRRGGTTRAKRYSKAQIRAWGKLGGRPRKLDTVAAAKLRRMLRKGLPKGEIAKNLSISTRTVSRYVATSQSARW
ncbi:MAG: helix-turn-helix domain-containing protein [Terriglobia bacterium]